jgi:LuxR family maltose regulon positive regulatory protein
MTARLPRGQHVVTPTVLGARVRTPARGEHHLRRARLAVLLEELVRAPITLVVAPAGAGKTSLLADWLSEATGPVAWASLDESDVDPGRFWTLVAAALDAALPELPEQHRSARARSPTGPVDALLAALGGVPEPSSALLVLDDVPVHDDSEAVMASLHQFLQALPPWLHVVLVARRDPRLPIHRMRAQGVLSELRFPDLRFSPDEAEAMLAGLVPGLPPKAVGGIARRSEGWAVGIQLGALVARSRLARGEDVMDAGETSLVVADFIWHEVLAAERPEVIQLLMDTSVVARFGPGLLQALTDQAELDALLDEAEGHGLFLTRLDTAGWYEFHSLVRQVLSAEAERRDPGRIAAQHGRAAQWFAEAGDVPAALDHWLLAGRAREALRLLAHAAVRLYDAGSESVIGRVLARLPAEVATTDPEARLEYAWCLLLTDTPRFLEAVDQLTVTTPPSGTDPAYPHRLTILESIATTIRGDWEAGARLAERSLRGFGDDAPTDWLGRFGWNMVARGVALSGRWDDQLSEVVRARAALSFDPGRRLAFEATRALGHALAGRPATALEVAHQVRTDEAASDHSILHAERAAAEAFAHRELGHRQRAEAGLLGLAEQPTGPVTYVQALAQFEVIRARLDTGDVVAARRALDELMHTVHTNLAGPGGLDLMSRAGTLVSLAEGDIEAARQWADRIADPLWRAVNLARAHLAAGDKAAARGVLDMAVPRSPRQEVVREMLMARAAESSDEAAKSLIQVVELASASGMVQVVASEGSEVVDMLESSAWLGTVSWLDQLRRAASRAAPAVGPGVLPDIDLTPRELAILRMLPSRLTAPEIATELGISVNTVKFHLKVVYRKLGVGSRAEAAQVARAMRRLRGPS